MTTIPWRVACQRVELQREGDPIAALDFMGNLNGAEVTRLRVLAVGSDDGNENIELEFTTGGYLLGYVFQPRWLKPFERPNMSDAIVRKDVAFRKAAWEAGRSGGEAPTREEFDAQYADESGEPAKAAETPEPKKDGLSIPEASNVVTSENVKPVATKAPAG